MNVVVVPIFSLDVLRRLDSVQEACRENASFLFFAAHLLDPVGSPHASKLSDDRLRKYKWQGCYAYLFCLIL